jgi:hypothetical protein
LVFLVPWERLPHRPYLLVPVLDFVAIGLMRNGAAPLLPGLAALAVFPVIWLSASGMLARSSLVLSFLGPFFIMAPTAVGHLPAVTASDLTTVVLFPVMMLAVSLAIRFASVNLRLQQRELADKDREREPAGSKPGTGEAARNRHGRHRRRHRGRRHGGALPGLQPSPAGLPPGNRRG